MDGDEDDHHQQPRRQVGASARAGRRAAAAPVGGSPGLMAVSHSQYLPRSAVEAPEPLPRRWHYGLGRRSSRSIAGACKRSAAPDSRLLQC